MCLGPEQIGKEVDRVAVGQPRKIVAAHVNDGGHASRATSTAYNHAGRETEGCGKGHQSLRAAAGKSANPVNAAGRRFIPTQ